MIKEDKSTISCQTRSPPVGGKAKPRGARIRHRQFSTIFRCSFRPKVVSDVISGVVVDPTGLKVCVKFGYSRPNRSRDIRLPHFVRTTTTPAYAGHHISRRPKSFCLKMKYFNPLFPEQSTFTTTIKRLPRNRNLSCQK